MRGLLGLLKAYFKPIKSEIQEFRKCKCITCPINRDGMCLECGCLIKYKIKVGSETCPMQKW